MKTCLLIVDVQKDFCPGGSLAVPNGDEIIPFINGIIDKYDVVIYTKDFHPANHKSFASNHEGRALFDVIDLNGLPQVLWPDHCVQLTDGANLHAGLKVVPGSVAILKGTDTEVDSYSAFFDNGKKHQTELDEVLKEAGITNLDVVGLATDYCVKATVIDALSLGYEVDVLLQGCRGVNIAPTDVDNAVAEMETAGARIIE